MKVVPPDETDDAFGARKANGDDKSAPFRALADAMPNQVWAATPDGLLDWFNTRVYDFSGAGVGTLDGEGWASIVHPDDLTTAAARWGEAVATVRGYKQRFDCGAPTGPIAGIWRGRSQFWSLMAASCGGWERIPTSTIRN